MFIARVRGSVVTTQKVETMTGRKLLIVEPLRANESGDEAFTPTGRCFVAVDSIGAGDDEVVLVTQGSSARMTDTTNKAPVDCVITGIIDSVSVLGKKIYSKQ
jgi:ethanolamine utilization protein EutN